MATPQELIEASIEYHSGSLDHSRGSLLSDLRVGICGGMLTGLGLTAEAVAISDRNAIVAAIGAGALVLGGGIIRSANHDVKQRAAWIEEDAATVTKLQAKLPEFNA